VRTADNDPVFPSKKKSNGGALKANQVRRIVASSGKRAGINGVSPHYFRHSHASHSLDRGASLQPDFSRDVEREEWFASESGEPFPHQIDWCTLCCKVP